MKTSSFATAVATLLFASLLLACSEETVVATLEAPTEEAITQAAVEQFVFRVFVDLTGNAPSETELATWTGTLRAERFSEESREALAIALQTDATYRDAYVRTLYQSAKARFLEGLGDAEIRRRFVGLGSDEDDARLWRLLDWQGDYRAGNASLLDLQAFAVHNLVYDQINMNSFNFVRATFNDLFWRYPTDAEFAAGFDMVEHGAERQLFGFSGSSKTDYVDLIDSTDETLEGTVIWQYEQLLARRPPPQRHSVTSTSYAPPATSKPCNANS